MPFKNLIKVTYTFKKKVFLIVAVFAIVFGYYFIIGLSNKNAVAAFQKPPAEVLAIKLSSQNIDDFEELPGRTSAFRLAEIRPQVDGIITKTFFTEGGEVKAGQQLYQIDDKPYQANYSSAKANLQKAKAALETTEAKSKRYQKLIEVEAISKQEYDDTKASLSEAKAEVSIAQAAVDKAKIYLNYTKVFAPISGRIGKSIVNEGSLVNANQANALAIVTKLDPIFVDIRKSSEDLAQFQNKLLSQEEIPVELYLPDGTIFEHIGTLQFIDVNIDPSTSSTEIRALFENPDKIILPGSFVKVRIKTSSQTGILIPQSATTRNPDGSLSVWIIDNKNQTQPTIIQTSKAIGNNWLVNKGLKDGDIIVTEGFQKIAPGSIVKPVFSNQEQ